MSRNDNVLLEGHDEPLMFQITDFFVPEADKSKRVLSKNPSKVEEVDYSKPPPEFMVVLYGCTAQGHSVCAEVTGYKPYFYLSVNDNYSKKDLNEFETYLKEGSYRDPSYFKKYQKDCQVIGKWYKKHLVKVSLEKKKEFMGFTNGKLFNFIKITVKSLALFNRLKYFFQNPPQDFITKFKKPFKLYESNIDPLLRFIHDTKILPCGWISLPEHTYSVIANGREDDSYCRTNFTVDVDYRYIKTIENNTIAPLTIASFDIECTSSHGDFPVANKDYYKLAKDLICIAQNIRYSREDLCKWILKAYETDVIINEICKIHRLYTTVYPIDTKSVTQMIDSVIDRIMGFMTQVKSDIDDNTDEEEEEENPVAKKKTAYYETAIKNVLSWKNKDKRICCLPKLQGDAIIQIGTTVHLFGSDEIKYKHIVTLKSCDKIDGVDVESYATETELLYAWKEVIRRIDPDMLIGYNIFGFDMPYIWERSIDLLGIDNNFGIGFGRKTERECVMIEQQLSSAALGDNMLRYFDLDGIVIVDLYKLMQRNSLESYKLDFVANLYLGESKNDIKPHEIFELYKGTSADRKIVAEYCIQDCALVNRLFHKLKVLENNTAMGNVCLVPLSYLFMRGQSIKLFSLVSSFCKNENFCIPVLKNFNENVEDDDDGYEGATVLTPNESMYLENSITVLDYSSLYPSSMIERNLSHDSYVKDEQYDNLEGVDYMTITYDIYEGTGDKKRKVSEKNCKFVQFKNNEKGIVPRILMKLLTQRKNTRKKMEYETITTNKGDTFIGLVKEKTDILTITDIEKECSWDIDVSDVLSRKETYNNFEKQVFDALQLAYKVTSNSLYGATGARVSPIYLKEIAACTTATGRERIEMAKTFVEKNYTGAEVIYGDTDSIFIKFSFYNPDGSEILGKATLPLSIEMGKRVENDIKAIMPEPQALLYEKTMFPFIIFSKKRYVGLLYEGDANQKPKLKSMGIVLKRRDNAMIVKKIYGGIIDILLYKYDLNAAVEFLKIELKRLINGEYPLEDLIVTKTLKGTYKDRTKIAHATLVDRMGERGDEKPQVNDRIPYVYIDVKGRDIKLQGDRIEHPDYIREHGLSPDYQFYITNQLTKPIAQIFALCVEKLPNYSYPMSYWIQADEELRGNKIYGDNDLKRHSRIVALKQKETTELLFDEFVHKKPKISKKKVVIQTHTLSLDETPKITLGVVECKEKKQFKGTFEFTLKNQILEKQEIFIDKKKTTKGQASTFMMLQIMKLLIAEHHKTMEEKGILLDLGKPYTNTLKKALEQHQNINDNLDKAVQDIDFENIQEHTVLLDSFKIVKIIYNYKYMFL